MTQGLSGEELESMTSMLDYVQGDFLPFYLDGVNQLSMMFLYGCLAVLLWMAMSSRLPRWWAAVALGMFFVQRLVLSLGNNGALSPLWMVSAIALGLMIIAVVVTPPDLSEKGRDPFGYGGWGSPSAHAALRLTCGKTAPVVY